MNASKTEENMNDAQAVPNLPMTIHAQYIKDASFENPNAPDSFKPGLPAPETSIDMNIEVNGIESDAVPHLYEVQLIIKVATKREDSTVFIAELTYGTAVSLQDVAQDKHHPMLLIHTPSYMFPFARAIISEMVQQGGYPPLLLNPVNFRQMYLNRFGNAPEGEDVNQAADL